MSLFRTRRPGVSVAETPSFLFRDLRRSPEIKFLWEHQGKILDEYFEKCLGDKNVAIELPTGSGKTLVGLLIAEFRRRKNQERVVYLCPTRQLCNQVKAQAESYGIHCSLLIGSQREYDHSSFAAYQMAEATAITTYSGIFNTNPKIDDPQVIICDDAHAAHNYIAALWAVRVRARQFPALFQAIIKILWDSLDDVAQRKLQAVTEVPAEEIAELVYATDWVDIIPCPSYYDKIDDLIHTIELYAEGTELKYPLGIIVDHLRSCNIYINQHEILIKPVIAPSLNHPPYANANQRLFMSATLGKGGDLERMTGIKQITRIPLPPGWDKRGTGRRLILFPNLLMGEGVSDLAITNTITASGNTLILVKENRIVDHLVSSLKTRVCVFKANDIEDDLSAFIGCKSPAALILANRYDGLDLPGDSCRRLVLMGLPAYSDLQEEFIYEKLGATVQFRDRIRTRITQGIGRCTRDENDYALVLIVGDDLVKWLYTKANCKTLHPELQAEIEFGLDNSVDRQLAEFELIIQSFFNQDDNWANATDDITERRNEARVSEDDFAEALQKSSFYEIQYTYLTWNNDFSEAYKAASAAVEALSGGKELKPYRCFWHYMSAISAFNAWVESGEQNWIHNFAAHANSAIRCSTSVRSLWKLLEIARASSTKIEVTRADESLLNTRIILNLLAKWGLVGMKFGEKLKETDVNIGSAEADKFEHGLEILGRMLGWETKRWKRKEQGSPDGMWIAPNNIAFVFEAKTDEDSGKPVSMDDVRQATTHEEWLRSRKEVLNDTTVLTVFISDQSAIKKEASYVAKDIYLVCPRDIRSLFHKASRILISIRTLAKDVPDEALADFIQEEYIKNELIYETIIALFTAQRLKSLPLG